MKDAFDLWWEWAQKPHESMLMISGDIHYPVMELSPEDRHDREKGQRSFRFSWYRRTALKPYWPPHRRVHAIADPWPSAPFATQNPFASTGEIAMA
jgi:hypothetical protein